MEERAFSVSRKCMFLRVYGLVAGEEKKEIWEQLGVVRELQECWCIGGDFNNIHFSS